MRFCSVWREGKFERSTMKSALKKISGYTWAFILVVVVFLTSGIFLIGNPTTAGEALLVKQGQTAYFSLETEDSEKLDAIYLNLGAIYTEVGEDVTVTIKTSTYSAPSASLSNWSSESKLVKNIANIKSDTADINGANYNWVVFAGSLAKKAKTISFSVSANVELKEIVCMNADGEQIAVSGYVSSTLDDYTIEELAAAYDAQDTYHFSESAYRNFTQEEAYYMASVKNVLSGSEVIADSVYTIDENNNYLATALFAPSVAIFGESVFALRLPVLLATCVLIVFAYLFVCELTKKDKYAFVFALLLCVGGLATSLGFMGAPYMFVASALVASGYFMVRFYSKGISSDHIIKGGMNVLLSGLFAAVALAIDFAAILPVAAILILFAFGMRRQKLAYKLALAKTEGKEETVTVNGEEKTVNKAADKLRIRYEEKNRISYGFAALSFLMGTVVLLLIGAVVCYSAFIRANGNVDDGFLIMMWRGLRNSVSADAFLPFTNGNWSSVWAWWLPVRASTVYTGIEAVAGKYLAWNVTPNIFLSCLSLLAVLIMTVKVARDFAIQTTDKKALRIRRMYFILLGGMAAALLAGCLKGQVCTFYSLTFHVLYLAFIPMLLMLLPDGEECGKGMKILTNAAIWLIVLIAIAVFVMCLPSIFGFAAPVAWSKWFTWTTFANNGYFR